MKSIFSPNFLPEKEWGRRQILRKMKLTTCFFLLFTCFAFANNVHSQSARVSIERQISPLKEVLGEIEAQTSYLFISNNEVDLSRKVPVEAENTPVKSVLEEVLMNTDIDFTMEGVNIILTKKKIEPHTVVHTPQDEKLNRRISGVVQDASGMSVIGANVMLKGTQVGVVTDYDGNFSLDIPHDGILLVSYIGFKNSEIETEGINDFKITLREDTEVLEEVVVVGFGTQKKVNLTGAVATVDSKALESRPVQNAVQALQGMVPGLMISTTSGALDNAMSINIRGTGTIGEGSSGAPLVLIDGMEGDLNTINPQDIENISILKDAAASSIYGSRAPFGVILVTTKSGSSGKTKVNYNNNFRWDSPVTMPNQMDSYTFATFYNDALINAGSGVHFSPEHLKRIKDFQTGVLSTAIPANGNYWADGYAAGNANTDWYDVIYRDHSFSQEHNLSLSGGKEKINYYASVNYLDHNGLMRYNQDTYNRYTATGKINAAVTDWMTFNYSSRFTRADFGRPALLTNALYRDLARQGWPTLPVYDPNGHMYSSPSPVLGIKEGGRDNMQTDNIYQQASLTIEPIKGWVTRADFNYRIKTADRSWYTNTLYNHTVDGQPYVISSNADSEVHRDFYKENYLNVNAYTEYTKALESGHTLKGMVGMQAEKFNQTAYGLTRKGVIVPELPEIDITTGLNSEGKIVSPSVNGYSSAWGTAGFFGRVNYDYKGRYLAELNLRYDGTSRFRESQRWNWFPSFSLGWNIAREDFWESLSDGVGTLKLRASYGELGNQNMYSLYPTYRTLNVYAGSGSWIQDNLKPNVAYVPELISSTLGWERVQSWNIGLDFGALGNRLTGSIEYFSRSTKDMIGPAPELPDVLGLEVPKTNNTDLRTYGFDLNIGWNDYLDNGFNYGATFILSDARTKITRYPNPTNSLDRYMEGQLMGEIYGYETIGIAKSKEQMNEHLSALPNGGQDALGSNWSAGDIMYKDLNGDGRIDSGSRKYTDMGDMRRLGNSTPRFNFGLDLTGAYKGFDLRVFLQGVMKRDYWQGSSYFWGATSLWHSTGFVEHEDYFRPEVSNDLPMNIDSYYPRPVFDSDKNRKTQSQYLLNAAYIRLKNLQLGYTFPKVWTKKFHVSSLRLFMSGENLWTGTSLPDFFDPETIGGGDGSNGNAYPLSTTFSFGLSVTL